MARKLLIKKAQQRTVNSQGEVVPMSATAVRAPSDLQGDVTLLELIQAVADVTNDEREIIATVTHMLRSGSVRLCGCLRGEPLDLF
jgi:hypothetical protein